MEIETMTIATDYSVSIDWPTLHALAARLDAARWGMASGGAESIADPFGGSYFSNYYEDRGIVGAISILSAARTLQRTAWHAVHGANRRLNDTSVPLDSDYVTRWSSDDCGSRSDMDHDTHRGAAWRATRYGGRVESRQVLRRERITARQDDLIDEVQSAVNTAIRVDAVLAYLAAAGLTDYRPENQICGVHDGRINLSGLHWLAGHDREPPEGYPIDDVIDVRSLIE